MGYSWILIRWLQIISNSPKITKRKITQIFCFGGLDFDAFWSNTCYLLVIAGSVQGDLGSSEGNQRLLLRWFRMSWCAFSLHFYNDPRSRQESSGIILFGIRTSPLDVLVISFGLIWYYLALLGSLINWCLINSSIINCYWFMAHGLRMLGGRQPSLSHEPYH